MKPFEKFTEETSHRHLKHDKRSQTKKVGCNVSNFVIALYSISLSHF